MLRHPADLSLALAKLEDELGVRLFERNKNEVLLTPMGAEIVEQARRVLDEVGKIASLAKGAQDQLAGALRLGVIATIGPYLLPDGHNKATCALANKLARICYACLRDGSPYGEIRRPEKKFARTAFPMPA